MADKIKVLPTLPETVLDKQKAPGKIQVFKSQSDLMKEREMKSITIKNCEKFQLESMSSHIVKVDFGHVYNDPICFTYTLYCGDNENGIHHTAKIPIYPCSSVDLAIRNELAQKRDIMITYKVEPL